MSHDLFVIHINHAMRDVLTNTYYDRRTGTGGPAAWPPCWSDLSPSQFLLVGTPKHPCVCSSCWQWRGTSHCGCLSDYPQLPQHLSMMRQVKSCTEPHGRRSEHLLYMYSFGHSSQIKCFWTHVHTDIFSCLGMWTHTQSLSAPLSYILYTECPKMKGQYPGRS
jgi:hypothetical protein